MKRRMETSPAATPALVTRGLPAAVPALLGIALLAGCGGGSADHFVPNPGGGSGITARQMVRAADGGVVRSADGSVTLSVPAGALAADTEITMSPASSSPGPAPFSAAGVAAQLGPAGLRFSRPATITMRLGSLPPGSATRHLTIMRTSANGLVERLGDVRVDSIAGTISGSTSHFSSFVVVAEPSPTSGVPTVELLSGTRSFGTATPDTPGRAELQLRQDGWLIGGGSTTASSAGLTLCAELGPAGANRIVGGRLESVSPTRLTPIMESLLGQAVAQVRADSRGVATATISRPNLSELAQVVTMEGGRVTFKLRFFDPEVTRAAFAYPTWIITLATSGSATGPGGAGLSSITIGGWNRQGGASPAYGLVTTANQRLNMTVYCSPDAKIGRSAFGPFESDGLQLDLQTSPAVRNGIIACEADLITPDTNIGEGYWWGTIVRGGLRAPGPITTDANGRAVIQITSEEIRGALQKMNVQKEGSVRLQYYVGNTLERMEILLVIARSGNWPLTP